MARGRRDRRSFSQKFWEDRRGNFVVWQKPNKLLMYWFFVTLVNLFIPHGIVHEIVGWSSLIALIVWAAWEAFKGVNYFRRTIGWLVLLLLIVVRL